MNIGLFIFKLRYKTNLSFTHLFCLSCSSYFYWWLFTESSHRPANTLSAAPPGMRFSHSQSSLLYLMCFFSPHHVYLLTLELSLSLALHLCHLSISLLLPASFLLADPFLFHASWSHLALSLSCFPHLALSHSWEPAEKAEKIEKQACDSSTGEQDSVWPETFPFSSISFLSPLLFLSLHYPGVSFQHTIFFPLSSPSPALSIFQFHVTSSKGGIDTQPCTQFQPVLGVGRVSWGGKCGQREWDMCQQSSSSQTDDECGWQRASSTSGLLCGLRSARQYAYTHVWGHIRATSVFGCYCSFTSTFMYLYITAVHLATHTIVFW